LQAQVAGTAVAANHGARWECDRITSHVVRIKTASCLPYGRYTFLAQRNNGNY